MCDWVLRDECDADAPAVARIVTAAFGRRHEADIVEKLRHAPERAVSMVALQGDELLAHVLFSHVTITPNVGVSACALGPVAVAPARQSHGIGAALIQAALQRVVEDFDLVFVLGNPRYYVRFGFELAARRGYHYGSAEFDRAFQVRAGRRPINPVAEAWVHYHPAFDE